MLRRAFFITVVVFFPALSTAQSSDYLILNGERLTGVAPFQAAAPAFNVSAKSTSSLAKTSAAPCWVSKSLPKSGTSVSAFSKLDSAVQGFMKQHQVPAGNLTIRRNGIVVLERGYGWQDNTCQIKMPYSGLFRIASLTKVVTNSLVYALVDAGKLKLTDKVFCVGNNTKCILTVPGLTKTDVRVQQITVQHLLEHSAGWDSNLSGNPTSNVRGIAEALKVASPPSKLDIVRYQLNTYPLDFNPGSKAVYSNFGYVVLGLVIEKVSGSAYYAYLQKALLAPMGVAASDMKIAGTLMQETDTRESYYSTPREPGEYRGVYDNGPLMTPLAYGGFHIESGGGAGALATTTRAYTRYLRDYWISGVSKKTFPCSNCLFLYYGSIPGAFSMAYQPNDITDIALFFDQRDDAVTDVDYGVIRDVIDVQLAKIKTWPTQPPSGHLP